MSVRFLSAKLRLATFIVAAALMPASGRAMDDDLRATSQSPTAITLCGEDNKSAVKTAVCKEKGYAQLVASIETAFAAAIARTPAEIRPLLKRDEVWFNEMIVQAATTVEETDEAELRDRFVATLRRRASDLDGIARGFGRGGWSGRWTNAFGNVTLTPDANGGWRLAIDLSTDYGSDKRGQCKLDTSLKPAGGWLSGTLLSAAGSSTKSPAIKLRRQGESLRVILTAGGDWEHDGCDDLWQITGSYFANGPAGSADGLGTGFVAPTFDCTRPESATDEEICADPELAENDQRLNRAWKALLPRLDDVTRRALMQDQRDWVKTQAMEFPEFLHPAWEKRASEMHHTGSARAHVHGLQRERIALLEGFDDKRTGLAGSWLANDAVLKVTVGRDGSVTAKGWKWEQGDWKAGCEYDMKGRIVRGAFRSDDRRKNPDTLERDHATLIVNRLDDTFASKRNRDDAEDEPKCRRRLDNSSTARLFPARPSPDIDNLPGSIR